MSIGRAVKSVIEHYPLHAARIVGTSLELYPEKYQEHMKGLSNHIKKYSNLRTITSPIGNGEEITLKIS